MTAALQVENLSFAYGKIQALRDVSLEVPEGHVVALVGANGAGKTTLLHCLTGLLRPASGQVFLHGRNVTTLAAYRRPGAGLSLVPEGRQVFAEQTVRVNLELGGFPRTEKERAEDLARVMDLFPRLKERQSQVAGTLSGGEQQMLAIGRALMARPRVLLLDEPSMGLAPLVVQDIFRALADLRAATRISMLLVEQNARLALRLADTGYVMETGRVVLHDTAQSLLETPLVRQIYLGERAHATPA